MRKYVWRTGSEMMGIILSANHTKVRWSTPVYRLAGIAYDVRTDVPHCRRCSYFARTHVDRKVAAEIVHDTQTGPAKVRFTEPHANDKNSKCMGPKCKLPSKDGFFCSTECRQRFIREVSLE